MYISYVFRLLVDYILSMSFKFVCCSFTARKPTNTLMKYHRMVIMINFMVCDELSFFFKLIRYSHYIRFYILSSNIIFKFFCVLCRAVSEANY